MTVCPILLFISWVVTDYVFSAFLLVSVAMSCFLSYPSTYFDVWHPSSCV